jgi:hypothetical protein
MPEIKNLDAAVQYLTWALEEIDTIGDEEAAFHARAAVESLRKVSSSQVQLKLSTAHHANEAKRFRTKADEAEELQQTADTSARRETLGKIADTYRRTAEQFDELSQLAKRANDDQ